MELNGKVVSSATFCDVKPVENGKNGVGKNGIEYKEAEKCLKVTASSEPEPNPNIDDDIDE